MKAEEGEKNITKRIEVARAPVPLEEYIKHFDPLFGKSNQREGFRQYMEGVLLPSERHKTLTGLVNTEPIVGAQIPRVQKLQWFLSESDWDERKVQAERLTLLREDASTAPNARGVLVIKAGTIPAFATSTQNCLAARPTGDPGTMAFPCDGG